jgi:hypothetical protein
VLMALCKFLVGAQKSWADVVSDNLVALERRQW